MRWLPGARVGGAHKKTDTADMAGIGDGALFPKE